VSVLGEEIRHFFRAARVSSYRTIAEFAEQEIWLPPGGPRGGERFSFDFQPWQRQWCNLIDMGVYSRFALVKPGQVGGSLIGFNLPLMYHLFERRESVGVGVPDMNMAMDKWRNDIEPLIAASGYRDLIPTVGRGSKGGEGFSSVTFKNGATMRFMTGHGGDKSRAGVTLRVLVVTEADGFDTASETSREADPISQMEARLNAHGLRSRVYLECTASIPTGRIWVEWRNGLGAELLLQCPGCRKHVQLERSSLKGWQNAKTELEAMNNSHFHCPDCDRMFTELERRDANRRAVLICRGQTVDNEGRVEGSAPETITAAMRVSTCHNSFRSAGEVGLAEWKARFRPTSEEDNLKSLYQFTWAMPWGGQLEDGDLTEDTVASRVNGVPRGIVPEEAETLVAHVDLHLNWLYWCLLCGTRPLNPEFTDGRDQRIPRWLATYYSVVDYGVSLNPDRVRLSPVGAMEVGLEQLLAELDSRDYVTEQGRKVDLDLGVLDGGFHQDVALRQATASGGRWRVIKGKGRQESRGYERYVDPKERTDTIRPGDHWYDSLQPESEESARRPWWLILSNTDHWMHRMRSGFLALPYRTDGAAGEPLERRPGTVMLFGEDPDEHLRMQDATIARSAYATQAVAWKWGEIKSKSKASNKGRRIDWFSQWPQDHWGDCTYGAMVADSVVRAYSRRFRPKPRPPAPVTERIVINRATTPDGRPFLVSDR